MGGCVDFFAIFDDAAEKGIVDYSDIHQIRGDIEASIEAAQSLPKVVVRQDKRLSNISASCSPRASMGTFVKNRSNDMLDDNHKKYAFGKSDDLFGCKNMATSTNKMLENGRVPNVAMALDRVRHANWRKRLTTKWAKSRSSPNFSNSATESNLTQESQKYISGNELNAETDQKITLSTNNSDQQDSQHGQLTALKSLTHTDDSIHMLSCNEDESKFTYRTIFSCDKTTSSCLLSVIQSGQIAEQLNDTNQMLNNDSSNQISKRVRNRRRKKNKKKTRNKKNRKNKKKNVNNNNINNDNHKHEERDDSINNDKNSHGNDNDNNNNNDHSSLQIQEDTLITSKGVSKFQQSPEKEVFQLPASCSGEQDSSQHINPELIPKSKINLRSRIVTEKDFATDSMKTGSTHEKENPTAVASKPVFRTQHSKNTSHHEMNLQQSLPLQKNGTVHPPAQIIGQPAGFTTDLDIVFHTQIIPFLNSRSRKYRLRKHDPSDMWNTS